MFMLDLTCLCRSLTRLANHSLVSCFDCCLRRRLFCYLVLIVVGGYIHDHSILSQLLSYFKYNNPNRLHVLFVKKGWPLVTFTVHCLVTIVTSLILLKTQSLSAKSLCKYLGSKYARLTVFVCFWHFTQEFFDHFLLMTSHCEDKRHIKSEQECRTYGFEWITGYDTSGHVFVLVLSNIVLIEECRIIEAFVQRLAFTSLYKSRVKFKVVPSTCSIALNASLAKTKNHSDQLQVPRFTASSNTLIYRPVICWTCSSTKSNAPVSTPYSQLISYLFLVQSAPKIVVKLPQLAYLRLQSFMQSLLWKVARKFLVNRSRQRSVYIRKHLQQKCQPCPRSEYSSVRSCVVVVFVVSKLVSIIWDLMLLQTLFFYHTTSEKLVSFLWTLICCCFLYSSRCANSVVLYQEHPKSESNKKSLTHCGL